MNVQRSRWVALVVLCAGMLMIVLDTTVVNVALPSIQSDLGFTPAGLAWVVNAYLISFGGLLLLVGRLGDLIGRRRVFLAGLALFTGASLLCGLSTSEVMLIAARFLQGVGGALTSAVILGMIVTLFPEPRMQAKAIGVYAFVASAGGAVGLLAGGLLTEAISWHWIFFVNIPIGVVTGVLAKRLIPYQAGIGLRHGADVPGAVLITSALMLGVYTIVKPAAELGWTAPRTVVPAAVVVALLTGFVVRQRKAANPLIPLRIFRSRNVTGANIVQVLGAAGMFGTFFLGSLYLQKTLGYDPLRIGLAFLPVTVVMGTLSVRYTERLINSFGARRTMVAGLALMAVGLAAFTVAPVGGSYPVHVLPVLVLLGTGAGLSFPALMAVSMSDVDTADAGFASGLVNTTAQVGGAIGLAVLATLSATRTGELGRAGHGTAEALTGGYHLAFGVAAALVGAAIVVVLAILPNDRRATPEPVETVEPAGCEEPAYAEAA
ncbi:MAG: MFS transporter [Streptosporangiales bacterium]|nr:MFS transporter [Streptosporangiales bacterium]MBO0889276.1 MFS transporter [Acidothermales bacterium]